MSLISVLDLSPIVEGSDAAQALHNSLDLARHAERLGYHRFWVAEHHNMPGIASAATAVVMGYVAGGTSTIRIGSGGIMLPNHAPLMVAEQFGTLATLYPGRIDLGVGRAPGTDQATAYALRRNLAGGVEDFPRDVLELIAYLEPARPGQAVRAIPGEGTRAPVWILGSSLYGAQLAAALGLPFAFASHFAPAALDTALRIYRERFKPSVWLQQPHVMVGLTVCAADTDEEARLLYTSTQMGIVNMRSGRPGLMPPPRADIDAILDPGAKAMLAEMMACAVIGGPETVERGLAAFLERTGADELIVVGQIFDHGARLRSFEIIAEAHRALTAQADGRGEPARA